MEEQDKRDTPAARPDEESTGIAALDKRLATGVLKGDSGTDRALVWIGAFLIVAFGFIVYLGSFSIPLHGEDLALLHESTALHRIVTAPQALERLPQAPLTTVTMAAARALSGGRVDGLHGFIILLHLGCAVAVYLLARRLLPEGTPDAVAMLAGLFFVGHPLASWSANYLVAFPAVQSTFFGLLGLTLLLRSADGANYCVASLWGALVAFCVAFGSDTGALMWPVAGIALVVLRPAGETRPEYRRASVTALILLVALLWAAGEGAGVLPGGTGVRGFLAACGNLLMALVWPFSPYLLPSDPGVAVGLAGVLIFVLGLAAGIVFRRWTVVQALALVVLSLFGAAFYGNPALVETPRAFYGAFAGLAVLLPWVVASLKAPAVARGVSAALAVLVLVLGGLTFRQTETWKLPEVLWSAEAERAPESLAPLLALARFQSAVAQLTPGEDAQRKEQEFSAAFDTWKRVLERSPGLAEAEKQAGIMAVGMGKVDEARPLLESAAARLPEDGEIALYQAYVLEQAARVAGDRENAMAALRAFRRAESLGPLPLEAKGRYGMLACSFGEFEVGVPLLAEVVGDDKESPLNGPLQQFTAMAQQIQTIAQRADTALAQDSRSVEGAVARVEKLLAEGRAMPAFYLLQSIVAQAPSHDGAWALLGMVSARIDGAKNFLAEWGASRAGNLAAWEQLAARCAASGSWDGAEAYLRHGMTATPGAMPELKLADIALQVRQADRAVAFVEAAQKAWPDSPLPWLKAADLSIAAQDNLRARAQIDEAEKRGAAPEEVKARRDKLGAGQPTSPTGIERTVIR